MSISASLHSNPAGLFPRTTMSFLESLVPCTPAKFCAILAGSWREPEPVPSLGNALVGFAKDPDGYLLELLQAPDAETAPEPA